MNLAAFMYDTPNLIEALGEELDSTLEKLAENPHMQQVYIFTRKNLENEQEAARLYKDTKEAGEALKAERALYEEGLTTPTDTETIMDDAELEERLDKIRIRASPQEREWTPISGRKEYQNISSCIFISLWISEQEHIITTNNKHKKTKQTKSKSETIIN